MKFSVLINNYNYARFLAEAVVSASTQTLPPHEIIVVDDGSTDDSLAVLAELQKQIPILRVHTQPNGGQLSAFRAGAALTTGDACAFLDSDDIWETNHLAEAAEAFQRTPELGLHVAEHTESSGAPLYHSAWPKGVIGPVAALVAATGVRFGSITSALTLRTSLTREILDTTRALDVDWRTRADDVLIYGAALSASSIEHGEKATVRYRIHGRNAYAHQRTATAEYRYSLRLDHAVDLLRHRYGLNDRNLLLRLIHEWKLMGDAPLPCLRKRYRRALRRVPAHQGLRIRAWILSFSKPKPLKSSL